jgi:hypothetical protein
MDFWCLLFLFVVDFLVINMKHAEINLQFLFSETCVTVNHGAVVVIVWKLDLQLPMQSIPIATNVVSLNPAHGQAYTIQHYVIKFVSDLRQFCGFPLDTPCFRRDIHEILLNIVLNTMIISLTCLN